MYLRVQRLGSMIDLATGIEEGQAELALPSGRIFQVQLPREIFDALLTEIKGAVPPQAEPATTPVFPPEAPTRSDFSRPVPPPNEIFGGDYTPETDYESQTFAQADEEDDEDNTPVPATTVPRPPVPTAQPNPKARRVQLSPNGYPIINGKELIPGVAAGEDGFPIDQGTAPIDPFENPL